ncbi:hypothetical protein M2324_002220 [Rhodovulum sulfidophilum]|uniref:DUF5333 domain-containing protein n=1 Tax=Rhodovulum sulfidophilum TaxID=35806 RepID=UPI001E4AD2C1|nr:DUF5333 domain-containing protein [Rhodovulum sulfidophilum]MCW2303816.1 hypothetical protein [Rhodovulum sulfidophilum]
MSLTAVISPLGRAAAFAAGLGLAATVSAAGAEPRPALGEQTEIVRGLQVIATADMIRKKCPTIGARMLTAFGYMQRLKSKATRLGYPDAEIRAFVEDKAEKARVETAARNWLTARGVRLDEPQSYCPVGLAEIRSRTEIGRLLRARQ